jgi:L-asparaginase / beta-aspartyl-peptidase
MKTSLIVHGGAWHIPEEAADACRAGCRNALEAGWKILLRGGSAEDAVEAAILELENDPVFDAGTGSHLNLDGVAELDAIIMNGATLKSGAVACVRRVKNPILVARRVMEQSNHSMFVAEGAEQFALGHGIPLCDPSELVIPREKAAWELCRSGKHASAHHDHQGGTVGAVAMDSRGHLVAATSTGGTCCKQTGRVGDSPLIGCGCYADEQAGGISCTGWGEAIMKIVMAKTAADMLRASGANAQSVADACIKLLAERAHGSGGLILLDQSGAPAASFNTTHMAWGYVTPDGDYFTTVDRGKLA